jgi:hypothetical protein
MSETFRIRIDGGEDREITVETGVYRDAAAAVPAILGVPLPTTVKIWAPRLVKRGYGPYFFRVEEDRFGALRCSHIIEED